MPDPKRSALVKTVERLATQKEEFATEENDFIEALDTALRRMGYRVVPEAGGVRTSRRRGRPPAAEKGSVVTGRRTTGRKRGRRSMSASERSIVSRRMKAYWAKRRRKPAKRAAGKKSG